MYDILSREPGDNEAPEVIHGIGSDALLDELWPGLGDSGPDGDDADDIALIAEAMRAEGLDFTFGSADDWLYRNDGYKLTGKMVIDGAARLGYCDAPVYF